MGTRSDPSAQGALTFGDFMIWVCRLSWRRWGDDRALLFLFRRQLRECDAQLKNRLDQGLSLVPLVKVPYKPGLLLITLTICAIASHHPLESAFGLAKNSVLLITPLICAGVVMILKPNRARHYIEQEWIGGRCSFSCCSSPWPERSNTPTSTG